MFNFIDIIVILIILISVYMGYKRGFVKTTINLVSFFVAIGLALMFYKPLALILIENTTIDDWIIENIMSNGDEKTELDINEEENNLLYDDNIQTSESTENSGVQMFLDVFENLPNTISENLEFEEIKNNTKYEIAYKVSELIMNLFSLIIIYVVVKVTLLVASFVLSGIMQIPVLKQINEMFGMMIGAVIGFIQIYLAFAVITFISSICDISVIINTIKISAFARILFENNMIINLLF